MRRILTFGLLSILGWFCFATVFQRYVIFPRLVHAPAPAERVLADDIEVLHVELDTGRVEAFFMPGDGVSADAPGPAVVWVHGNGEQIDTLPERAQAFRWMGASVLMPEYRGYGRSDGSPSEAGIVADTLAFCRQLAERPDVDAARIVYYGTSLGGGVVCGVAKERPPAALILAGTFRSIRVMAARYLVPPSLIRDPFDNEAVLRDLRAPVLVMHGRRDRIIPFEHGVALAAAAGTWGTFVEWEAGHGPLTWDRRAYWETVRDFLVGADVLTSNERRATSRRR